MPLALKGSSASIGAYNLALAALNLEKACHEEKLPDPTLIKALETELNQVTMSIQKLT